MWFKYIVSKMTKKGLNIIWCDYLSRFVEKQRYACQATTLLKITEHDEEEDIRERNRIGQESGRRKETVEKQQVNYIM